MTCALCFGNILDIRLTASGIEGGHGAACTVHWRLSVAGVVEGFLRTATGVGALGTPSRTMI